jgi:NADPH:quinone reductase-like Zn-dependent oxidoreductase
MGAHAVVDHRNLVEDMKSSGYDTVDYIVQYADLSQHWDAMCELVAPQGKIGTIVETDDLIDISQLQGKSASLHWELMFTRTIFQTDDMAEQNVILSKLSELTDAGTIRTTLQQTLKGFSVDTLKEAHRRIEKANVIGKLAVEY